MLLINNIINKFRNTEQRIARIKEIENELVEVTTIRDAIVDSHVDISKSIESGLNEDMISRDSNFIKDLAKLKYRDRILNKELDILKGFRDIEEYDKNEKKIKARKILKSLYRSGKLSLKMYNEADSQKTDKGQVKYADVIVLNKNGELLLLKRSQWEDAHQGAWVIPGGHVDAGESYEQAAIRELREESGISVDNLRVNATIYPVNWVLGGKYSDDNASIEYYILRLTDDVELLLDEAESRDYIWIKRDEIDNYPMVFNMQTNVKKVLGWDETPQVKIIRKAIEKGIIPIDRVVDIVKAIAQIGEIRQWQDGTYRKVGNGVWEKIKGDKGRTVADSTMLTVIKKEREKYFNEYKKVEDEFIKKYKEINGDESYKISYRVRLSRVMSEDSSVKEAKDLYSVRYKELQSEINEIHSKIGDIARSKREQEHGGKKELDVKSDLFNEIRDYYNIFKESENKFVKFTTANKAIPDVTVDDYWLATNAVFNMFYEYEVIEKENGIFSNNDVVGKFEDMKNSGKFEYTESPKSSSKYLVDRVNGDIYRFSDHWGRCATCYWGLIGSKKYEYGIAVCNIKEFERNDHYGFSNPKYRNSILAGAYVALDGINKILNNKGFYFDKAALLRIKGYIDNIGKSLYSTFTSHDREQLDMIKEKYKDLFEEKYLKDENINKSLNEIKGGKADKRTVEDIAKKHNVFVEFIEEQLKKGIKIEHEHTDSEEKAREIAMDHICEIKDYYDRLEKMEEEAKKDIEKAISDSSDMYIKGEINDDLFDDMNEVIEKAVKKKDLSKLKKIKKLIYRDGKLVYATYYVKENKLEEFKNKIVSSGVIIEDIVEGDKFSFITKNKVIDGVICGFSFEEKSDLYWIAVMNDDGKVQLISTKSIISYKKLEGIDVNEYKGGYKFIKNLGGSTGAELVEDIYGNKYVRKKGNSYDHIKNEYLALKLYKMLGVDVPNVHKFDSSDGVLYTEYIENAIPLNELDDSNIDKKKLAEGFGVDILLANWDVLGMNKDNILYQYDEKTGNSRYVRVDVGGSMYYRAQGEKKSFVEEVIEVDTMLDSSYNKQTSDFFKDVDLDLSLRILINKFKDAKNLILDDYDLTSAIKQVLSKRILVISKKYYERNIKENSDINYKGKLYNPDSRLVTKEILDFYNKLNEDLKITDDDLNFLKSEDERYTSEKTAMNSLYKQIDRMGIGIFEEASFGNVSWRELLAINQYTGSYSGEINEVAKSYIKTVTGNINFNKTKISTEPVYKEKEVTSSYTIDMEYFLNKVMIAVKSLNYAKSNGLNSKEMNVSKYIEAVNVLNTVEGYFNKIKGDKKMPMTVLTSLDHILSVGSKLKNSYENNTDIPIQNKPEDFVNSYEVKNTDKVKVIDDSVISINNGFNNENKRYIAMLKLVCSGLKKLEDTKNPDFYRQGVFNRGVSIDSTIFDKFRAEHSDPNEFIVHQRGASSSWNTSGFDRNVELKIYGEGVYVDSISQHEGEKEVLNRPFSLYKTGHYTDKDSVFNKPVISLLKVNL